MKKLFILLLVMFVLASCAPENKTPTVETPPSQEETPVTPETPKEPFEESPLSSVVVTTENPTKTLQGTWLMYTGGNITDNLIVSFDYSGENHKAVYADKEGNLLGTMMDVKEDKITQIYISGLANYTFLNHKWNSTGTLSVYYTDSHTGRQTIHNLLKYSDSFIDEAAYDDATIIHGLWVNSDKSKGLRFLPDDILWTYSGNSSEKCRWKDSDGNTISVVDSFGFSEKVPFAKIGDNLLIYKGEKYYKID